MTEHEEFAPFDIDTAHAAYEELATRLDGISGPELIRIRSPLLSALSAVERVAEFVQQPAQRSKFAALADFDLRNVDDLNLMAAAYWYARVQLRVARSGRQTARVPAELIEKAAARKARMFRLLEYHLGSFPLLWGELEELRSGTTYEDLASDLIRLAELHEAHRPEIVGDTRHYIQTDAELARAEALQIITQVTERGQSTRKWATALGRCAALLSHAYRELISAAGWIYRHDPEAKELFPSLHDVGRSRPVVAETIAPPALEEIDISQAG